MAVTPEEVELFINTISQSSDYDFGDYSIKSFTRRVDKLLMDNRMNMSQFTSKLNSSSKFLEQVVKDITVNTTELFRDPAIWQTILSDIIPRYQEQDEINIWHAGCSTGQEVFSMSTAMHTRGLLDKTNVYATDLNSDVIDVAKSGKYKYREIDEYINNFNTAFKETELPEMSNYIEISRAKSLIKVKSFLTRKPTYKKHNLVSLENPFEKKFDIIFCRNVLIYFNHELQNRIFEMFHEALVPGGAMIIGRHEGILGDIVNKFEKYGTIYIKR